MTASPYAALVERIDPRLDSLIGSDAVIEVLFHADTVAGPHWLEGPAWDRKDQALLFSDTKGNVIYRWHAEGGVREFLRPAGIPARDRRPWRSLVLTGWPLIPKGG